MSKYLLLISLIAAFSYIVLGNSNSKTKVPSEEYIVDNIIDLHKDTLRIPSGRLIRFSQNAIIRNGVVIFQSGDHFVEATKKQKKCIVIGDNTEVIIDGNIKLIPNDLDGYNVFYLKGDNIMVKGYGSISGDKSDHLGNDGEWGHGIQVSGSGKISINNISINNCWGDCIYVRSKNADILIDGCTLDHGRRQGISITAANSAVIRNTFIKNVKGKSPQYAIDVEPNANDTIKTVTIHNVRIKNCIGGIVASSRSKNSYVGSVEVDNCKVEGHVQCPYYFNTLPLVSIMNCKAGRGQLNIIYKNVLEFNHKNNVVTGFKHPVTQTQ